MSTDFQKPQLGRRYANYENLLLPFEVTVEFWRRYGMVPEEVIFAKPGMWLAGPLVDTTATDDASCRPPTPEVTMGAPIAESGGDGQAEKTEAAPDLDGQARLL